MLSKIFIKAAMNRQGWHLIIILLFTAHLLSGCEKFVDIPAPPNKTVSEAVFSDEKNATSALLGIYSDMMNSEKFINGDATLHGGLASDELTYYTASGEYDPFKNNDLTQFTGDISSLFWGPAYKDIYAANAIIEKIPNSPTIRDSVKRVLTGEAKFIRALYYFYMVNYFGDVPLITQTDFLITQSLPRTAKATVYTKIISDLKDAESSLSATYIGTERIRPNKWAAAALLARVYLYTGDWANAETEASNVINSDMYSLPPDLNLVFKKTSSEIIFALQVVSTSKLNTQEGTSFLFNAQPLTTVPTFIIRNELLNAFELNDQRKAKWTASKAFTGAGNQTFYYPYKYKAYTTDPTSEYNILFRYAEQFLVRAEARAQLNNIAGAQADLNIIRNRAGLANTLAADKPGLLAAVEHERQVELFAELGHRWFDLKRTNRADAVLSVVKGSTWQSTDALWPLPQPEIAINPALAQNPGY